MGVPQQREQHLDQAAGVHVDGGEPGVAKRLDLDLTAARVGSFQEQLGGFSNQGGGIDRLDVARAAADGRHQMFEPDLQ